MVLAGEISSISKAFLPSAYFDIGKARTFTQSLDNLAARFGHMNNCTLDYICIEQLKSVHLKFPGNASQKLKIVSGTQNRSPCTTPTSDSRGMYRKAR